MPFASGDGGAVVPHGDELLVERVHGIRIVEFLGRVDFHMIRVDANPRFGCRVRRGETGILGGVPLHGGARVVAADEGEGGHHGFGRLALGFLHALAIAVEGFQIAVLFQLGEVGVGHTQFLAFVNVRGAAVHVQHHAERLGAQLARIAVGVVAPTGDHARLVMIAEEQAGPTGLPHGLLLLGHTVAQVFDLERHGIPLGAFLVDADMVEQE